MPRPPTFEPHDRAHLQVLAAGLDRQKSWDQICAYLAQPRMEKSAALWLPFMENLLARWPNEARYWPDPWLKKKTAPAATSLVRCFRFGGRTEAALTKALAHLSTVSPEAMPPLTHFVIAVHALDTSTRRVTNADRLSAEDAQMLIARMSCASMRHVRIEGTGLPRLVWEALATATWNLDVLHIKGVAYDADLTLLMRAPSVRFRALVLGDILGRIHFGTAAVDALVTHHGAELESLTLTESIVEEASLTTLSEAAWPMLERLAFERQRFPLCAVLPRWLANAPRLRALDLSIPASSWKAWNSGKAVLTRFDEPDAVIQMFAQHPLPPLESLRLDVRFEHRLGEALRALFGHEESRLGGLKHLILSRQEANAEAAQAIQHLRFESLDAREAKHPFWHAMRNADLSHLKTLAAGAYSDNVPEEDRLAPFELAKTQAHALEELDVDYITITHPILDLIESAPYFKNLKAIHGQPTTRDETVKSRFHALRELVQTRALDRD